MDIAKLRKERSDTARKMREIHEGAEAEERALNADEDQKWNQMRDEVRAIDDRIKRAEEQAKIDAESRREEIENEERNNEKRGGKAEERTDEQRAFENFIRHGKNNLDSDERRALSQGTDSKGGFLAPEQFNNELIKFIDDMVWIRQNARVLTLNVGESIGTPSLDADPDDADWTSELGTGSEDDTMAFGKRKLEPQPLAKRIKVSRDLLESSAINVEQLVRERLGYKFGVSEEKGFLTGNGAGQPLGVFTADANGISTSRDVSTGNTTSAPTFDGLKAAKWTLKAGYRSRPSAAWIFHRECLELIDKLKDGEGRYIWQPSVVAGTPDTLLTIPVLESEFAPNTFTTGQYVGVLGDWRNYWIAEIGMMNLQRLDELYAETNQTGFIGRSRIDGMPVLEEAFVRVKLG